jgi:carbon-monoxide dehydrogenase small subunit
MTDVWQVNGEEISVEYEADDTLLKVLRAHRHTEVKAGCETGECGACLVLLNGKPVNSCQVLAFTVAGAAVTTVTGIGTIHDPHPIQQCLAESGAVQCGYCTPGIVVAAYALLLSNPDPTEEEIRRALDGNLCRCGGYTRIIEGVRQAAARMRGNG